MLTRIYALCFETKAELEDYLKRRELAEAFDHKKLGRELDLYHIDETIGKGLPLWLPNGAAIRHAIETFAKEKEFQYGYSQVSTPVITRGELYERSGHLKSYKDSMFPPMVVVSDDEGSKEDYYLRPMNCPHHHKVFASRPHSYRDLPLRLSEYGNTFRYEQSGELSGLIRVRAMCMNDAHIYCTEDQLEEEFQSLLKMYYEFYDTFRLGKNYSIRLSIRDKEKDKFEGDDAMWSKAEKALKKALDDSGLDYYLGAGEAAFYGPKIDFQFKNLMGREETVSTIQVDFLVPKKFGLEYKDEKGQEKTPVCIHRAPLSTHERFLSFLIEYYGGAFPTWCAPVQVAIVPVMEQVHDYARSLREELHHHMIRVIWDDSPHSFSKKIRTHTVRKVPNTLIIGEKELNDQTVTVRRYGEKEQRTLPKGEFIQGLLEEISARRMDREPMGSIV